MVATTFSVFVSAGRQGNTDLYSIIVLCFTRRDFEVLLDGLSRSPEDVDTAYYVLESQRDVGETVTILQVNAVIGGCARLGDVNRTMQTFEALESAFGLKPNTETYNMLFLMAGVSGEISRVSTLVQVRTERLLWKGNALALFFYALMLWCLPRFHCPS